MLSTRTRLWLFAGLWLVLTGCSVVTGFTRSTDRSALAIVDWGVLGLSLGAPLFALWRLDVESGTPGEVVRRAALRLVLIGYVPLWTAMRILERTRHLS